MVNRTAQIVKGPCQYLLVCMQFTFKERVSSSSAELGGEHHLLSTSCRSSSPAAKLLASSAPLSLLSTAFRGIAATFAPRVLFCEQIELSPSGERTLFCFVYDYGL